MQERGSIETISYYSCYNSGLLFMEVQESEIYECKVNNILSCRSKNKSYRFSILKCMLGIKMIQAISTLLRLKNKISAKIVRKYYLMRFWMETEKRAYFN